MNDCFPYIDYCLRYNMDLAPRQIEAIFNDNMRCDLAQYKLLRDCVQSGDMILWNTWRKENSHEEIWLQGCDFSDMNLSGANFSKAHLECSKFIRSNCDACDFWRAYCNNVFFNETSCRRTHFRSADLINAKFWFCNCEKAVFVRSDSEKIEFRDSNLTECNFSISNLNYSGFISCTVNQSTFMGATAHQLGFFESSCVGTEFKDSFLSEARFHNSNLNDTNFSNSKLCDFFINECYIDDNTLFDNCKIDEIISSSGVKSKIQQTLRRKSWENWYQEHIFTRWFIQLFWLLSDYGYNSRRIFFAFVITIIFFALIYTLFPSILEINGMPIHVQPIKIIEELTEKTVYAASFKQMLFFSTTTMVTLGFGNINVASNIAGESNEWGMLVVTLNAASGYFLLAVLVTRLAIFFQNLGPGYVKPKNKILLRTIER